MSPTLLDLHRSGSLATRYPEVRGLLADLPPDVDLAGPGRLLTTLDPDEVLQAHPATPVIDIAVTGHGTLDQLVPPLTAELARHGMLARTTISDFDSYVFDLGDPASPIRAHDPELVLCVLDPMVVFDDLPTPWQTADVERAATARIALIERLAARFAGTGRATLVLNTLPLPHRFTAQCVDHRSRARLGMIWREANSHLLKLAEDHPSVVVLDLDPLLADGVVATDPRLSTYARAHLSPALLGNYAREVGHLARHLRGTTKKVLVLDLDGTLWGGTLGEDGIDGIEIGDGYRGMAFHSFQQVVKQLGSQGVLLAVVSKNDLEPVRAVLAGRAGMALGEDDLVRIVANWRPKHDNLRELAEALNLGVDGFVFVDDNPAECGLIRHELPEVAVVPLGTDPALHAEALLRDGWFDGREVTAEDRVRVSKYRDELVRKDFLDSFDSVEDYLLGLRITVEVARAAEPDVPRLAQLTLRTNQFNLTAARLQPENVRKLIGAPDVLVLTVKSADRFGGNGLVGAVFAHWDGTALHIDNVLMSCRVFSRGIEQAFMSAVLGHARAHRAAAVFGHYRATAKNGKVADFYLRHGFTPVAAGTYRHDLATVPLPPEHLRLTDLIEGDQ